MRTDGQKTPFFQGQIFYTFKEVYIRISRTLLVRLSTVSSRSEVINRCHQQYSLEFPVAWVAADVTVTT